METQPKIGMNRTGIAMSPLDVKEMIAGTEELMLEEPTPVVPVSTIRNTYLAEAEPVGAVESGKALLKGDHPQILIDQLGGRLAFERGGVRLYQAMLAKCQAQPQALSQEVLSNLQEFHDEELEHFHMLADALRTLGADPTAMTPCADLVGVKSMGLVQATRVLRCSSRSKCCWLPSCWTCRRGRISSCWRRHWGTTSWRACSTRRWRRRTIISRRCGSGPAKWRSTCSSKGTFRSDAGTDRAWGHGRPPHPGEIPVPKIPALSGTAAVLLVLMSCGGDNTGSNVGVPGESKSGETHLLEGGAHLIQDKEPVAAFSAYLDGFHFYSGDPAGQMEAHHYVSILSEDVMQAVIFDGNTRDAKLMGVEYIISERLFKTLPDAEKKLWHSHRFEVASGALVAPGLPQIAEKELMKKIVTTYGKTWHTWHTDRDKELPLGIPALMMGFTQDGQLDPRLLQERDARFGIDTQARREQRVDIPLPTVDPLADAWEKGEALQLSLEPAKAGAGHDHSPRAEH
jgi:hypothetical protein